jgi:predicted hydrocarbon binding protein
LAEPSASRGDAQLKTLMKLSFILDAAGEDVLGKGAPAMMYQAGRDIGRAQHPGGNGTVAGDDVEEALGLVLTEGEEVWQFERWQDPGNEGLWMEDGDRRATWLLFRRCPLMTLAKKAGSRPGGILCQAMHGYISGSMEGILARRVDIRIDHCGPRACKLLLELR